MSFREILYYSLGFLPSLFFGMRFLIQWIASEKQKKSTVGTVFWRLSISGNILLALHYFIQLQFQFLILQVVNGFISWRNLNFLQTKKEPYSLARALAVLGTSLGVTLLCCTLQVRMSSGLVHFLDVPAGLHQKNVPLAWHVFGILGATLFASRFWIQWWDTERNKESFLGQKFWILSILGSAAAFLYFLRILDWVNLVNYAFGLIPYVRNLVLIRRRLKA